MRWPAARRRTSTRPSTSASRASRSAPGCASRRSSGSASSTWRCAEGRPQIFVERSKRGKSRAVDVGPGLRRYLERFVREVRPRLLKPGRGDPGTLLLSRTGRPLDKMGAERRWKTALKQAGLAPERVRRLGIHAGRHTFATRLLESGKSLAYVRDQLGHANISTTSVYLGVADLPEARGIDLYEEGAA